MTIIHSDDQDQQNRNILRFFLDEAEKNGDSLSLSTIYIMTQFLMSLRLSLMQKAGDNDKISTLDVIDAQINSLRECVIELESYKKMFTEGATLQ